MVIVYQEPRRSRQKGTPPHFNPLSCCAFLPIIPEMFHMNMLGNNVMLGHLPFLLKKRTQVYIVLHLERGSVLFEMAALYSITRMHHPFFNQCSIDSQSGCFAESLL